jgi:hypothetical protein
MSEISGTEAKKRSRLRWVTLGEAIAIAALIISGLGLWREFNKPDEKPVVVEKTSSIPLALRGRARMRAARSKSRRSRIVTRYNR